MRWAVAVLLGLGLTGPALAAPAEPSVESEAWTTKYDHEFQKYTKRYFGPGFDWRWFKAQAIAESHLNPNAQSAVGAKGLMQIMPATFQEIRASNPHFEDIVTPKWNIAAGIYYNRYLYSHKVWTSLPEEERLLMAFASYNAGLGGALRAFRKATPQPADSWASVEPHAPRETRGYVRRITLLKKGEVQKRRDPRLKGFASRIHRSR